MARACDTYGWFWWGNLKESDTLKDVGIDTRVITKMDVNNKEDGELQ
jgi:hypothetical protein